MAGKEEDVLRPNSIARVWDNPNRHLLVPKGLHLYHESGRALRGGPVGLGDNKEVAEEEEMEFFELAALAFLGGKPPGLQAQTGEQTLPNKAAALGLAVAEIDWLKKQREKKVRKRNTSRKSIKKKKKKRRKNGVGGTVLMREQSSCLSMVSILAISSLLFVYSLMDLMVWSISAREALMKA